MPNLELKAPPALALVLVAAAMWPLSRLLPAVAGSMRTRLALATAIALAGIAIVVAGVAAFRRARTTVNPLRPATATSLVTTGVYRFTRNPMYVGMLWLLVAWAVFLASPLSLAGPVAFILYMNRYQIEPEERAMRALFGDEYEAYRARVRRWL